MADNRRPDGSYTHDRGRSFRGVDTPTRRTQPIPAIMIKRGAPERTPTHPDWSRNVRPARSLRAVKKGLPYVHSSDSGGTPPLFERVTALIDIPRRTMTRRNIKALPSDESTAPSRVELFGRP